MRIGEVADRAGVRKSLLRYYEDIGLIEPRERIGGQRRYDESVLRRLAVIDVAQRAGLSLDEVRELLDHGNDPVSDRLRELAHAVCLRSTRSTTGPSASGRGSATPPVADASRSMSAACSTMRSACPSPRTPAG